MFAILHSGCSPDTLRLKYTYCELSEYLDANGDRIILYAVTDISRGYEVIRDIVDVNVQNEVILTAENYQKKYCDSFEYLVNNVAFMKEWAIIEQQQFETQIDRRIVFTRTWTLKPATKATMYKVSTVHESDESFGKYYEKTWWMRTWL